MSDIEPEQITDIDDLNIKTPKVKDPRKVKAGKALARKNAEARKNEEVRKNEEDISTASTFYNGILTTAGLVGAGFTLYHGWKFFERQDKFIPNSLPNSLSSKSKVKEVESEEVKEVGEMKSKPTSTPTPPLAPPLAVSPSLRG